MPGRKEDQVLNAVLLVYVGAVFLLGMAHIVSVVLDHL